MTNRKNNNKGLAAGPMADIAFLLLIFFLVTTVIDTDKGIQVRLPELDLQQVGTAEENILNVFANGSDDLMIEDEFYQKHTKMHVV